MGSHDVWDKGSNVAQVYWFGGAETTAPSACVLEDYVYRLIAEDDALEHVVLHYTAVNEIDLSALDALEAINHRLQ